MIQLDASNLIGRGKRRECYTHPADERLCIKVTVKGDGKETRRETAYYRHLQRRNISWELIPRYHGPVATNLGQGHAFDVVRDFDGNVSRVLKQYFASPEETARHSAAMAGAMEALKNYMFRERIITMELMPGNIAYRRTSEDSGDMMIIDNIGNSDFLPVCNYFRPLAHTRVRRTWQRFGCRLRQKYAANLALLELLSMLSG